MSRDFPKRAKHLTNGKLNTMSRNDVLPFQESGGTSQLLLQKVDHLRATAFSNVKGLKRSRLGQFSTPPQIASHMAAMFQTSDRNIRLLDPGAGIGTLSAAFVEHICSSKIKPKRLEITAFEIDPELIGGLSQTLSKCGDCCSSSHMAFEGRINDADFIEKAIGMLEGGLFKNSDKGFDYAILNPPYRKINSDSKHRRLLRQVGIETGNLYSAFLALAVLLLRTDGELVAITPRSFCNGPYFKSFRKFFLSQMRFRQIYLFNSRDQVFKEDGVLQENVIFHAIKTKRAPRTVLVLSSQGPTEKPFMRHVSPDTLVKPGDPESFIHVVVDEAGQNTADLMGRLKFSLNEIGLSVSTGPVVDFRCRDWLQMNPSPQTIPLIYPAHFSNGWISWPKRNGKKPNAFISNHESRKLVLPSVTYVLTKRFSAKEEKRRIVAAIFDPGRIPGDEVAFKNHLNYFHCNDHGLSMALAKGLTMFLNSTLVDTYFRQFNGHTQVNASDLRNLRYPAGAELEELGNAVGDVFPDQQEVDRAVLREFTKWLK